ncbi:MAG TPA: hypothetical protein VID75_02600 [Acidimicrobiales bacterium]
MTQHEELRLDLPFRLRGRPGAVRVTVVPNPGTADPGCEFLLFGMPPETFLGYPVCTATVDYDGDGYGAVFGWTQLVRSTDNATGGHSFEIDPIAVYQKVDTPFAWFGVKPTLFDAPIRFEKQAMQWECDSFLCFLPDATMSRHVRAVCGFRWGFEIEGGDVMRREPIALHAEAWNALLPVLRSAYGRWTFDEDLQQA